ncbi:hypothetical protein CMI47_01670 [Candidatus Pacearchaeota archaeon]|nr:hypothetical protein [Candidatus Pacearchaeota archaeon]|tara:strand:- start:3246 stop:3695 length:450 start_codon:yes stop_codon:yes gene_type:complete
MSLDDYNYYNDSRTRAARQSKWYTTLDESTMTAQVMVEDEDGDEILETMPVRFEKCGLCDGTGSHVNPSIDSGGLTSDDFYDDPDFAEEYTSGRYDVTCYECGGKKVTAELDESQLNDRQKEVLHEIHENARYEAEYEAMVAAERRFGC